MVATMPGMYSGASWVLNTRLPEIPPMPPKPVKLAEQKARFHWPRILFAYFQNVSKGRLLGVWGVIACLVGHDGGYSSIHTGGAQEDTKVSDRRVGMESQDWEANNRNQAVYDNNDSPRLVAVSNPSCNVHQNCGECVRRRDEALGCGHAETEVVTEDDGKEDCLG
jgi:hypothetical protein